MPRQGELTIKAVQDEDDIKEFILYRMGSYKEPIGILSAFELRKLHKIIDLQIEKLGNQDLY